MKTHRKSNGVQQRELLKALSARLVSHFTDEHAVRNWARFLFFGILRSVSYSALFLALMVFGLVGGLLYGPDHTQYLDAFHHWYSTLTSGQAIIYAQNVSNELLYAAIKDGFILGIVYTLLLISKPELDQLTG